MDIKKMGMTELIAYHNQLATVLGVATETSFKSLGAARTAIINLESKKFTMDNTQTAPASDTNEDGTANTSVGAPFDTTTPLAPLALSGGTEQKYNSTGKRGPNQGVGAFAKELIMAGKSNSDALAMVLARFPNAKTTTGCIAFYRTALTKTPGGVDPEKLRADAKKLLDQADAIQKAREAKAAADLAAAQLAAAQLAAAAQAAAAAAQPAPVNAEPVSEAAPV